MDGCTGGAPSTEVGGFTGAASIDEASIVVPDWDMGPQPMGNFADMRRILHVRLVTTVESTPAESIAVVFIAAEASIGAAASIGDLSIEAAVAE